jgi:hypothetical protein
MCGAVPYENPAGAPAGPNLERARQLMKEAGYDGRPVVVLDPAGALDLRGRVQQRIWTAVEEAVTAAGLDPRVANAVWDAFFGRSVTPRYYRPLADVSPATATNDLAAAVAAGLLRPAGRARSRRYQAGASLYPRIGSALGLKVDDAGEPARAIIIGELTRRVGSETPR